MFDKDGSGEISPDEIREVLSNSGNTLSMKIIEQVIGEVDVNGDGLISFDEFRVMMKGDD